MTIQTEKRMLRLEELSARMLRHAASERWGQWLVDADAGGIRLEQGYGTVLSARIATPAVSCGASLHHEIASIAACHGGELDPWPTTDILMVFQEAGSAMQAALDLHRLGRPSIGLATGMRDIALVGDGIGNARVSLGPVVDRAGANSELAPAGTIRMSPETFLVLQDELGRVSGCLLTTEFQGDDIEAVSLVRAPAMHDALSTFAGLGLT